MQEESITLDREATGQAKAPWEVKKTGPLDEAEMFIQEQVKRLSAARQLLSQHADSVFGEQATKGQDETTTPVPISTAYGGKLIQLSQALTNLSSMIDSVAVEVRRNCQL